MDLLEFFETKYLPALRRIRSKKTVGAYRISLRQFADAIGHAPMLDDLTDEALIKFERYLESRGAAPATIRGKFANLIALWNWAAKKRHVWEFPTLDPIRVPPLQPRAWTEDEVLRLLAAAKRWPGDSPYLEKDYGIRLFVRMKATRERNPGTLANACCSAVGIVGSNSRP